MFGLAGTLAFPGHCPFAPRSDSAAGRSCRTEVQAQQFSFCKRAGRIQRLKRMKACVLIGVG